MLAFACAFTMFAGAAFTDSADIKATDAVNMLTALGVIDGYEDGSFKPEGTVTRAEMAKMIFVVRNNKIDDSAYKNNTTKFTDVNGHWAAGYIKFCESQGIIAGKTPVSFDPNATVTGVEAAKMLLVVAGYDANRAGLTGSNWKTNTLKYAGAAGILDNVDSGLEAGLPRQYAAQIIYNALDTNRVKWSTDSESFDDILNGGVKETVGKAYMGLSYDVGTLTSIDKDSLTIKLDQSYESDNYHSGSGSLSFTKVSQDYTAFLGQKVKVMFKDGKTNNVLGVYSVSDNTVYNTLMKDVELDGSKIKFGGKSYSVDNTRKVATTFIGINGTTVEDQSISYFDSAANSDAGKVSLNEVTFVDSDGNGKIDTAIVTEKKAAEVTNVSSDKITFDGKSYKFADENIDDSIKQDDWAVMSANLYEDCKNIVKADVLTTEVDSYKAKNNTYSQYRLDSNWYNIAASVKDDAGVSTGDSVKAYVVNGVIVKMETASTSSGFPSNIAIVVGSGSDSSLNGDQARLRFFDGSSKLVTLTDKSETAKLGTAYKVSGSDSATKLEKLTANKEYNGYKAVTVSDTATATPDSDTIKGVKVDDNAAVILYTSKGRSKQITGKQFKALKNSDVTNATAVFTKKSNGLDRVQIAAVTVSDINVSGNSSDNYAYITSDAVQNKNNDLAYTIWTGIEYIDVTEEGTYGADSRVKGMLIGYSTINSDKMIQDVTDDYGTVKDATNVKGTSSFDTDKTYRGGNESTGTKLISVDGKQFNVTADTTVLFVDSDADSDEVGQAYTYGSTEMRKAQKDGGDYTVNVFFKLDEKGTDDLDIDVLVLDTTGAFKGFKPADNNNNNDDTVTGDYVNGNVAVNYSGDAVSNMAASLRGTDLYVGFDAGSNVKAVAADVTAKVDGVKVASNHITALTLADGSVSFQIKDENLTKDNKVVVDIKNIKLTPYNKTVIAAAQSGTITAGTAGDATFKLTTTDIADGKAVTVTGLPTGVTVNGSPAVSSNAVTVTLAGDTNTVTGESTVTFTVDGVSATAKLTIS